MKRIFTLEHLPLLATAFVLGLLFLVGALSFHGFASLRVVVDLFGDNAFVGVAAVGATLVILSGGIDLSAGAVVAFTGILIARLMAWGLPPWAAIGAALFAGLVLGAAQGALIYFFILPPFLVTLAGMFLMRGLAFVVHPQSLAIVHPFYTETVVRNLNLSLTSRVAWPLTASCLVIAMLAGWILTRYTTFGRNVYALGSNETSAYLLGVPVGRMKVAIYALAGFCSALGGVVATFYMQSGNPASFVGLELDIIAAVVIGGTLLTGGGGSMLGTLAGVLILGLIQTLISFQGTLNSWWTRIAIGGLLLVFIGLQRVLAHFGRRVRP